MYFVITKRRSNCNSMDVDIVIKKDVQPQYTGEEMAVFLILNYLQNDKNDALFVTVDTIGYFLMGSFIDSQNEKNLVKGIKKGFERLNNEQDIRILDQTRNNYIIDSKSCRVDTKEFKFIIIKLWEIQKIFSAFGAYGFNVLRFFVNIVGTINGNSKSWHMTQDDMVDSWNFSKNTVIEYLCKLEELKLLYVFRSKSRKMDETFHRVGNVYGRYCDKDLVISEGIQYLSTVPNRPIQHYFIDRTSIKLRYNNFLKGSKKYNDMKEVGKLYKDCIKYNESFKKFPNDDIGYIDLSVFEAYGFKNIPVYEKETINKSDSDNDDWGEPDPMEKDYPIEEIVNMPTMSDVQSTPMNPVKTVIINKPVHKETVQVPKDVIIQRYADDLYRQYADGTGNEKSVFIAELSEEYPGLDNYDRYYDNAKKFFELNVL